MSQVITAPSREPAQHKSVFLAGGITNCPDWQSDLIEMLKDGDELTLFNPRRDDFDVRDPAATHEQIKWEHQRLHESNVISFWFPCETLCPITLYELGAWSMTPKWLIVGCHPKYQRRVDVIEQTALARPTICIGNSLERIAEKIAELP